MATPSRSIGAHSPSLRKRWAPTTPMSPQLNNLAALYHAQGRYAEVEPLYKRSLGIREKVLGPNHPDVATALNNLAALYQAQGRYAEAAPLIKRALAISEKTLGPDHRDVATKLNNLALLYNAEGRYAEAEPLYQALSCHPRKGSGPRTSEHGGSRRQSGYFPQIRGPARRGGAAADPCA